MAYTLPFYLFTGPEFGEKNDALQNLRTKNEKKFGQLDFHTFYANETKLGDIMAILTNGSLFSDARFVVVKNSEVIKKKDELQLISDWVNASIQQQIEDSILVLISDENSVDKKLENLVPKENKKMFWEMFEDRKIPWLKNFFSKNGYKIEEDACETILNLIENNTEALRTECSRFFLCFDNTHLITSDDVDKILAHNREESSFTLFDAMADSDLSTSKRLEKSLEILQKIRQSKDSSYVPLIAGLLYCFRQLKLWISLHEKNYPTDFDLKINGFSSKKVQSRNRKAATLWNLHQTQSCISLLSATDMQLRSSGTILEETIIQTMIYEIITKKGSKITEYQSNLEVL